MHGDLYLVTCRNIAANIYPYICLDLPGNMPAGLPGVTSDRLSRDMRRITCRNMPGELRREMRRKMEKKLREKPNRKPSQEPNEKPAAKPTPKPHKTPDPVLPGCLAKHSKPAMRQAPAHRTPAAPWPTMD